MDTYSVVLEECDKIDAIKVYNEVTKVGLKEAKKIIDGTPGVLFGSLSLEEANKIVKKFIEKNCLAKVVIEQTMDDSIDLADSDEIKEVAVEENKALKYSNLSN